MISEMSECHQFSSVNQDTLRGRIAVDFMGTEILISLFLFRNRHLKDVMAFVWDVECAVRYLELILMR